jgi:hypothetical protein
MKSQNLVFLLCLGLALPLHADRAPAEGFQGALWGSTPAAVRDTVRPASWARMPDDSTFPKAMNISRYSAVEKIAGYPAEVTYYFINDSLFQATARFDFSYLKTFDFNYNVFVSVDKYYSVIHDHTVTFVRDIYDLLLKKYGKRQPIFKGLDPRFIFTNLDKYLNQERWNFHFHPAEYYKRIVTAGYSRWDFPKTRVIFSINISAADSRFDYLLSATSLEMEPAIEKLKDDIRMKGL